MEFRKLKVLFVCVRNASRSQIAEAWLEDLFPDFATAQSAGFEPSELNPLAVEVMQEVGIDISQKATKGVLDLFSKGERYDRVIGVCDQSADEKCPFFPGLTERLFWSFPDPANFEGTHEQQLAATRKVRDDIRAQIESWVAEEQAKIREHEQASA